MGQDTGDTTCSEIGTHGERNIQIVGLDIHVRPGINFLSSYNSSDDILCIVIALRAGFWCGSSHGSW